jgi:hypothetical protein
MANYKKFLTIITITTTTTNNNNNRYVCLEVYAVKRRPYVFYF